MRRQDDQVAGDVRGEQPAKPEEADGIHASRSHAEHGRKQPGAERAVDRGRRYPARPVLQLAATMYPSVWLFGCRDVGLDHLRRIDDAVELLFGDEAELECRHLQGQVVVHRVMRDLRCFVVTDHR